MSSEDMFKYIECVYNIHMRRKQLKKESILNFKKVIFISKLFILGILLFFFSKYKPLLLIIIFEILDLWKTVLQRAFPQLPLNLDFIFGVTASYFFSPLVGIIIYLLAIVNRIIFFAITYRHLAKGIRYLFLFILIPYLKFIDFYLLAIIILVLNYVIKYIGSFFFGPFELEDTFYDAVNFLLSSVVFYLISMLHFYLPFLL